MNFELDEEFRKLQELVAHFVHDRLLPLEPRVLAREAAGEGFMITAEERAELDEVSKSLGLWGLDAPEDIGGLDLPAVALVGVNEEIGKSVVPYVLPPDSPNLRMLDATVNESQRAQYLEPYVRGILSRYGEDPRVAIWDLYNEPGNDNIMSYGSTELDDKYPYSLALLQKEVKRRFAKSALCISLLKL